MLYFMFVYVAFFFVNTLFVLRQLYGATFIVNVI